MSDRLRLEYIPLSQAVLWDKNPKAHDIGGIVESIRRYGFKDPPKFEPALNGGRGGFAEGNGRTIALRMMRQQGEQPPRGIAVTENGEWAIPVLFGVDAESEAAAQAYAIDHNNLTMAGGEFAAWDMARMWDDSYTDLLQELAAEDWLPVSVDGDDLDALLANVVGADAPEDPGPQVDRAAELQEKWQVALGDVWQAGEHFIACGDCRETATWERLLAAADVDKVNGVFTSPPYAEQRKKQYGGVPVDQYVDWWEAVQANVRANLANDGSFFVNIKPHCEKGERVLYVFDLVLAMKRCWGWRFVDELYWKRPALPGDMGKRFKNEIEPVYHFARDADLKFRPRGVLITDTDLSKMKIYDETDGSVTLGSGYDGRGGGSVKSKNFAGALPSNVIEAARGFSVNPGHGAIFPASLPAFFIRAYSDPGDVWIDPFLGSGTTIVAAHQNERRGLGIELLEKYVAVALERLAGLGLEPRQKIER